MDGQGILPADDAEVTRGDVAQVERAIRLRWQLPDDLARALPARLEKLTQHSDGRIACRAAKALLDMNQQNGSGTGEVSEPQGQIVFYLPRNGRESPQVSVDDGSEPGSVTHY